MTLSQPQLRLISSIGVGILVGTALIVIIPEGVSTITEASMPSHTHSTRDAHIARSVGQIRWVGDSSAHARSELDWPLVGRENDADTSILPHEDSIENSLPRAPEDAQTPANEDTKSEAHAEDEVPTFYIGISLILGFILMFLIDRLPRIASENFQPPPAPRQISLSNLGGSSLPGDEEETEGFLGSLTPTPKQTRSLATTTGLVIHAAADGIAMGASSASSDTRLGLIVFVALMIHKAPAAFALTSVLLKQGLSKRAARGHLIVFSLASPLGAWATYILVSLLGGGDGQWDQWWTGMLLLFSAGTFLYVAMHAMQEGDSSSNYDVGGPNGYPESGNGMAQRKHGQPQMRETMATVVGMLLPILTQFGHHH